jgi:Alpha/beta hydrolase domain
MRSMQVRRRACALAVLVLLAGASAAHAAGVPNPTVEGPIEGGLKGYAWNHSLYDLAGPGYDYTENEYFYGGTATDLASGRTAPYESRMLVRLPRDPRAFSGTVLVEWLNVTAGIDEDPDFGFAHDQLLHDGWAYVGVSAQKVGVEGGSGLEVPVPGFDPRALKQWDPERYRSLSHPGDAYSYDIFSQAAQAIRRPGKVDLLGGLEPTTVLAAGESQSATRMVTYVDAVQPVARIYDGFLIHSRDGGGAPLGDGPGAASPPDVAHIRGDLDQPVLQFQTETDLFGLGFFAARQPDTDEVRTWEVAGTSHVDQSTLDYGIESGRRWNTTKLDFSGLCGRLNEGPEGAVLRRALTDLRTWVVDGRPPPEAPPLRIAHNSRIARDDRGNALGGIRTPPVDAPVATLTGESAPGANVFCSLFGSTTPFSAAALRSLYPDHKAYVDAVTHAATSAVDAGFLLETDAHRYVSDAEKAPIPS